MPNNTLWLVHRPTGRAVRLAKRMGYGWHAGHENVSAEIDALMRWVEENHGDTQDDLCVAIEANDFGSNENQVTEWTFAGQDENGFMVLVGPAICDLAYPAENDK